MFVLECGLTEMTTSESSKNRISGFAPIFTADAHTLILGSMPGGESLKQGQYYANPRNVFWRIMSTLTGNENDLPYERRLQMLNDHRIALWDVLHSCERAGSLDSAIEVSSAQANDFRGFLAMNSNIRRIFFNGTFAEVCYRKHVLPQLSPAQAGIAIQRLPSTSPANASVRYEDKLRAWGVIFE